MGGQAAWDRQTVGGEEGVVREFGSSFVKVLLCPEHPQCCLPGALSSWLPAPDAGRCWARSMAMLRLPQPLSQQGPDHLLPHRFVPLYRFPLPGGVLHLIQ